MPLSTFYLGPDANSDRDALSIARVEDPNILYHDGGNYACTGMSVPPSNVLRFDPGNLGANIMKLAEKASDVISGFCWRAYNDSSRNFSELVSKAKTYGDSPII